MKLCRWIESYMTSFSMFHDLLLWKCELFHLTYRKYIYSFRFVSSSYYVADKWWILLDGKRIASDECAFPIVPVSMIWIHFISLVVYLVWASSSKNMWNIFFSWGKYLNLHLQCSFHSKFKFMFLLTSLSFDS